MNTILELREKRSKIWNTAKEFLDQKRGADGIVPPEAAAEYDKMETDMVALGKEIERLERQQAYDLELSRPTSLPITNAPTKPEAPKTGRASNEYKEDFSRHLHGKALLHNVMTEGVDADGGYLVPTEFEHQIVSGLDEANIIRSLAKVITTSSERKIPLAASHSVATWTAENGAYTESNPTFGQTQIDAFKLTDLVKVSTELLQDNMFDLESYIAQEFARAFGIAEEQAFCVGTGTGQPTGIFTANGGQVGVTANSATAITVDNVLDLVYSLKSPYRRNAVFLMNDATVSLLRKLKDSNGAYLWQPSVQAGQPDRLIGYPIYTSPYVPAVAADAFVIAFGDYKNYWIADRQGRTVQRLNELYSTNGQVGFIATERVDGKVILAEGIKLLKMAAGS
ncbi:phage major capsid protein [Caproiciproducens sp. NJN-50]|uniref:phage major capsid protein n=1 Tax=Caproiciproducens sp. NJN-50 TaxID=2507162 RepID=UPI000E962523|nr:phage major capsid protein [Caproiciproducens sp. NJN-50]QAT50930.1 phage major capsid protein [Caproiciproducens sp. NJN-50]HBN81265.1 phage major capsid protein [Oscillospiraceae bacterium]